MKTEWGDNRQPGKAFSGIIRKEFGHDTAVGSSLETFGLRLIFLRKIIVIDGFRICHRSIFYQQ